MNMDVISSNLPYYREINNLSPVLLAKMAAIPEQKYIDIESGKVGIDGGELYSLSNVLKVRRSKLRLPVHELKIVRFRSNRKLNNRARILVDTEQWLEDYKFIEHLLGNQIPFKFDEIMKEVSGQKYRGIIAAGLVRQKLGLGPDQPVRNLCTMLEESGIKIGEQVISSHDFLGLSVGPEEGGPAIVINTWSEIPVERWIYTVAHELGHLVLHKTDFDVKQTIEEKMHETEANEFATEFLVPKELLMNEWNNTNGRELIDRLRELKKVFQVSYQIILKQLVQNEPDFENIVNRFRDECVTQCKKALTHNEEPDPLSYSAFQTTYTIQTKNNEIDVPSRLEIRENRLFELVKTALKQEKISLSRGAEILQLSLSDLREITNSWVDLGDNARSP